ncbi:MAG: hypothetical protein AAFP84_16855 [Actinomycetota bacterium]
MLTRRTFDEEVLESFESECGRCRSMSEHERRVVTEAVAVGPVRVPFTARRRRSVLCTRCGTLKGDRDLVDLGSVAVRAAFRRALIGAAQRAGDGVADGRTRRALEPVMADHGLEPVADEAYDLDTALTELRELASPVIAGKLVVAVAVVGGEVAYARAGDDVARRVGRALLLSENQIDEAMAGAR